jgi:hypothetical protein
MILPIGEGMVFTIKDEYTFLEDPEADERFEKIMCRFCGKTATVSMLNFERNGKFLSVGGNGVHFLDRGGFELQNSFRKGEENLPLGCQRYRFRASMKKFFTDFLFQFADTVGDGGLRHGQLFRRQRKVLHLGKEDKGF